MAITGKGGRPLGLAKTGGRQKGTPNRTTLTLKETLDAMGCDPLIELAKMGMNEKKSDEFRKSCFREIAPYVYPKRKPVDALNHERPVINLKDCTARGEIVLDAFPGSGTTLIDAERAGGLSFTEKKELAHG